MGKHNLPITDGPIVKTEVKTEAVKQLAQPPEPEQKPISFGSISLPLGPLPGYIKRRVDVGRMTREQSERLAAITSGLQFQEAKLKNGSPVKSEIHAIRWVLENCEQSAGKP